MRRLASALLVPIALTAAVYLPVARFDFVELDDPYYVYNNATLKAAAGTAAARYAMTTFTGGNWHPLVWASFFWDRWAWHLAPGPMHAENAVLHGLSAVVLLLLWNDATGRLGRATAVAALFACHPMHVESVAWVSERKDVLSTLPLLLAACAYVRYARTGSVRWYAATLVAFATSLAAKSMGVTLPAVLLLLDVWPLGRTRLRWRRLAPEKLPLIAMAAVAAAVAVVAQRSVGATHTADVPLAGRLANAVVSYAVYGAKLAVPTDLAVYYPWRPDLPAAAVVTATALLVGVTFGAWRWRRSKPYLIVGWLWFVGTLVPTIGLVQVGGQSMADRYSYFPSIGLSVAVVWLAADLAGPLAGAVVAAAAVVAYSAVATVQVRYWRATEPLFAHAAEVTTDNDLAYEFLAGCARRRGDDAAAARFVAERARLRGPAALSAGPPPR